MPRLVVIRNTINLEPAGDAGCVVQLPVYVDVQIGVVVRGRIFHGVALSVPEIGNLEVGCILCSWHKADSGGDPAAVQRTRDVEDLAFAALRVVDDPALVLALVVRRRVAGGNDPATIRQRIGESKAIHFKGQVPALGQITNDLLEPILKEERVF